MWERTRNVVAAGLMLIALGATAVVVWWLLAPGVPSVVTRVMVRTPVVMAGADLVYDMVYSKQLPLPARVIRTLENDELIYLPIVDTNLPTGNDRHLTARVRIPLGTPPGHYVLRVTMEYRRNPLVVQDVVFVVGPFDVE